MKNKDKIPVEYLGMVPVLTTQAGRSLTVENWREATIQVVSFYLAELLMKPGCSLLNMLPNLATFVGWPASLVLNATLPFANEDGCYSIRSHYDGRQLNHFVKDILAVIEKLQPTLAVLPQGVWQKNKERCQLLPESIFTFIPVTDLQQPSEITRRYGVYFTYDQQTMSPEALLQQLARYKELPCYVAGELNLTLMLDLIEYGVQFVESNSPAADACRGLVYCSEGELSLFDELYEKQFRVIDTTCCCPVCRQGFSRAYLHHLYQQTPLLCQRLLVQHNVFYCQARLKQRALLDNYA